MITVKKFKSFLDDLMVNDGSIESLVLVVQESHAVNKLKDKTGVVLMAIYPTGATDGDVNSSIDASTTWLFILEKPSADLNDQEEIDQYDRLQETIEKIKSYILGKAGDVCWLQRLAVNKMQIVPEWKEFGGFNGWSMSLTF